VLGFDVVDALPHIINAIRKGPAYEKKVVEVHRAVFAQTIMRNPFAANMFIRCATEMFVSSFNKLKVTGLLDRNKAISMM